MIFVCKVGSIVFSVICEKYGLAEGTVTAIRDNKIVMACSVDSEWAFIPKEAWEAAQRIDRDERSIFEGVFGKHR